MNHGKVILAEAKRCGANELHIKMAAILCSVNGIENALEFLRKVTGNESENRKTPVLREQDGC